MMTDRRLEEYLQQLRQLAAKHPAGIAVQGVGGDPPWAYTIGLLERHGFEIIVFLLPMQGATAILNAIALSLNAGVKITPDVPMHDNPWIKGYPALFKLCDPVLLGDRVNMAKNYHRREDVPVYQLVLCDKHGHFPGDAGYSLPSQPLMFDNAPEGALSMWTIYDHPDDHPGHFVARRWEIVPREPDPVWTSELLTADSLEALRDMLPPGLYCLPRQADDDPKVVETWL